MKATAQFTLGKTEYTLSIEGEKDLDTLHSLAVLGNPPQYCHECQNNEHFRLDSNKDKDGNTYVNVVCTKCGAKAKLGLYKVGGYFWHKFEKYIPKTKPDAVSTAQSVMNEDEAPF